MRVVYVPSGKQRAEDVIRAAQDTGDPILVLWGTFCQLGNELSGGQREAKQWLRDLVAGSGRPLAISSPSCDQAAEAHFLTPPGWSDERTLGWLGGLHEEVEATLGPTCLFYERGDGSRERVN